MAQDVFRIGDLTGAAASELNRSITRILYGLLLWSFSMTIGNAGPTGFRHIVIIVQENRTPDNLFQGLCVQSDSCSTSPSNTQYNIQTGNWANGGGTVQPQPVALANTYDLDHSHWGYNKMCDRDPDSGICRMDGAARVGCHPDKGTTCPSGAQFKYVDNSTGIVDPYLALATQYGWANYMFQTNQGPSYPAHQFLFGGTSAPNADSDRYGIFAAENVKGALGCPFASIRTVQLINSQGVEGRGNRTPTCFYHETVADLMTSSGYTWRYYAPGANTIWTAPNSIEHICEPKGRACTGASWKANVALRPTDVLSDISKCELRRVSWVVPSAAYSDHAGANDGEGPSWVASVVNTIGNSRCIDAVDKSSYWDTTAIFVTWDDWGGWYDHVAPPLLSYPQNSYQYGFRVPLIVVSAYTPQGYVDNYRHDFGSIIKFIEYNFGIGEGALGFADARGNMGDLREFFYWKHKPRKFQTIPARFDAGYFIHDKRPPGPPDND